MKCPLCGGRGEPALVSFVCEGPGCANSGLSALVPGSRAWARALWPSVALEYRTTYHGRTSPWHRPNGDDRDPSWPGFDAVDTEPDLSIEWRRA